METHALHNSDDVSGKGKTPYITRSTLNNGLAKYAGEGEIKDLVSGNAITVAGESSKLFYQPVNFIVGTKVAVLRYPQINQYNAQYMITCIEKATTSQYGFSNILTGNRVVEATIQLPVTDSTANTPNPEPDWEYMENYIKTIERKFIDQIAEHNSKEQEILEQLHPESVNKKPEAHGFEEIRVGDFIEFSKGKRVTSAEQLPGSIPYVTAATESNGIDAWISNPIFTDKNLATVNFFGKCFYHPYPVAFKDGTYGMRFKDVSQATSRHYFYFMTALEKVSMRKGSYAQMLTDDLAAELHVRMPITPAGKIDWNYMEQYITWVEARERERVENYVQHVKKRSSTTSTNNTN